jgi:hypothetical protein
MYQIEAAGGDKEVENVQKFVTKKRYHWEVMSSVWLRDLDMRKALIIRHFAKLVHDNGIFILFCMQQKTDYHYCNFIVHEL